MTKQLKKATNEYKKYQQKTLSEAEKLFRKFESHRTKSQKEK
jgi:hypothetical protein